MPLPDPTGWAPDQVLNPITNPMTGFVNYGTPGDQWMGSSADGTPIRSQTILPQEYWPSEEEYQRTAEIAARFGLTPPPRGTLDDAFTQQLGRALWEESQRESASSFGMGSPGWAALVNMGGAAAGGAFANGGAGYGAVAPSAAPPVAGPETALPSAIAPATAAPAGIVGPGSALGGMGSMPAIGATGGIAGGAGATVPALGGAAAGGNFLQNWLPYITGGVNTLLGYNAADEAADTEAAAIQAGIDEQRRQFDTTRSDLMPWLDAGRGALTNLQTPGAFQASPGYEWLRSEGERDIGNSFAARGGAASGNALRALSEFQTGLASQDYNNWWNRQAGLAGVGQNTAVNLGGMGANMAGNVGNALANQGISRASGVLGRYSALGQGLQDATANWLYRRPRRN